MSPVNLQYFPIDIDPVLVNLDDAKHIVLRGGTQRAVHQELRRMFGRIKSVLLFRSSHSVSALKLVQHGQAQHSPPSKYRKHKVLGEALDYRTERYDDNIILIVFDWNNGLLTSDTICALYNQPDEREHFRSKQHRVSRQGHRTNIQYHFVERPETLTMGCNGY